jgi:hypothetical protein
MTRGAPSFSPYRPLRLFIVSRLNLCAFAALREIFVFIGRTGPVLSAEKLFASEQGLSY